MKVTLVALLLMVGPASLTSSAQAPNVDTHTTEALIAHARQSDAGKPLFTEIMAHYPNHYTMLVSRHADGQSELHERYADIMIVLEGKGEIITGGTMQGAKQTAPGEQRGTGVGGGTKSPIQKGDIVHVAPNVAHQILIPPNGNLIYYVVKVQQ